MSAVWVVRGADKSIVGVGTFRTAALADTDWGCDHDAMDELHAGSDGPFNGYTVTRETLLTPEQRDVLVSAAETRDFYRANVGENGHPFPLTDLFLRVDTLRAQEGENESRAEEALAAIDAALAVQP